MNPNEIKQMMSGESFSLGYQNVHPRSVRWWKMENIFIRIHDVIYTSDKMKRSFGKHIQRQHLLEKIERTLPNFLSIEPSVVHVSLNTTPDGEFLFKNMNWTQDRMFLKTFFPCDTSHQHWAIIYERDGDFFMMGVNGSEYFIVVSWCPFIKKGMLPKDIKILSCADCIVSNLIIYMAEFVNLIFDSEVA